MRLYHSAMASSEPAVDLKGLEPLCRLRAKQMLTQLSYRPSVEMSPAGPSP
jgi:hypothetical protein